MTETRDFTLADVLSITTGRLVSHRHIDGVYDVPNFMTGDQLFTHQLPRACDAMAPVVIEQHPWLADVKPADGADNAAVMEWLRTAEAEHPQLVTLAAAPERWRHQDPISELVERVGPDQVIAVNVSPEGS